MVTWHVNTLKISHINPAAVNELINRMDDKFGQHMPLSKLCWKGHDYLGMVLNFEVLGQVTTGMEDQVNGILV